MPKLLMSSLLAAGMSVEPTVRRQLLLSKELLSRAEYQGSIDDSLHKVAHDVLVSHDAAGLALAAICGQLGYLPLTNPASLMDYFAWLGRHRDVEVEAPGTEYFEELHKARMDLQHRHQFPDPQRWGEVRTRTLEYLGQWSHQYLGLDLKELDSAAATPEVGKVSGSSQQDESDTYDQRREHPRYSCSGDAEICLPSSGPLSRGTIVTLSLGGCYIEMDSPFNVGRRVEMMLRVNRLSLRAIGQVMYRVTYRTIRETEGKRKGTGMGIKFVDMSAGGRQRLQELVREMEEGYVAARNAEAPSPI
jgi:hypothetical protein